MAELPRQMKLYVQDKKVGHCKMYLDSKILNKQDKLKG